ncbi:hypothetical protein GCM10023339_22460 [Alloalcanivorax gelatiniphagus]
MKLLSSILLAVVLSLTAWVPAHAGPEHDHTDPGATGCNRNAYQITRNIQLKRIDNERPINAYMQIFYSRSCGTNWIRLTRNPYGTVAEKLLITDIEGAWRTDEEYDTGYGSSYGMQLYAPGCIIAQITIYDSRTYTYGISRAIARAHRSIC